MMNIMKTRPVNKQIWIFIVFQLLFIGVTLPLSVLYGPFDAIRLKVITYSTKAEPLEKMIHILISDKRYNSIVSSDQSVEGDISQADLPANKDKQNFKVETVKTDSTAQNRTEQATIPDSELRKLGAKVTQDKPGSLIYEIIVSIEQQKVYIFDVRDRKLIKEFICSTGLPGDDTPKGTYKIALRGESFFNEKYQDGAYYWTQFMGNYLFHSIPFDKNRDIQEEEGKKLGQPASHGCVRLETENAKWIYDNIPTGTPVTIE